MKATVETTVFLEGVMPKWWVWSIVLRVGGQRVASINSVTGRNYRTKRGALSAARRIAKQLNLEVEE